MFLKIISGAQDGVDRAALDLAIDIGLPHGGFCTLGRRSESGIIPDRYQVAELMSKDYATRTRENVLKSDGTLIINKGPLLSGTKLTYDICRSEYKHHYVLQIDQLYFLGEVRDWIVNKKIKTLNVAGPRESRFPGIHDQAYSILHDLICEMGDVAPDPLGEKAKEKDIAF